MDTGLTHISIYIVIIGTPIEGFEFFGPFPSFEEAQDWAYSRETLEADWWISSVSPA